MKIMVLNLHATDWFTRICSCRKATEGLILTSVNLNFRAVMMKNDHYLKRAFSMEILCHWNGFANPHGFSPGMKDGGCDDDFERSRISCPLWKRELLIETSLWRVLSIANTPLMQLNGNIRNCYDFLPSKQYIFSQ